MNTIGIALVWCVVQVTLLGLLTAGLYLVVRRFRPAAAASVVLTGLAMVVMLSLLVLSPRPRWTINNSPLPLGEGQGVRAAELDNSLFPTNLPSIAENRQGVKAGGDDAVSINNQPSAATILWQSLLDELAKPQAAASTNARRWPRVMAVLLLAAMACGLGWLMLGVAAVRWQRLRSRPVLDGALLELVDVLRAELGCCRPVEVRQSDDLATAATIGWRRPVLLLPADWTTWTADQRRAVLAHEIVHARSHDFLALLCGQLGLVLHFYHPLLHWLIGRLRLEQELAADAAAASVSGGQQQYLMTIAELALRQQDRPLSWPARSFLPTRTTFLRRIAMLRDSKKLRFDRLSPVTRLTTIGAVLFCGLLVAGLRGPAGQPQALAEDRADVTPDNSIDTSFLTENPSGIVVIRPSAVFARPELAELAKLLEQQSGNVVPRGTRLTDFRQITVIVPDADLPTGSREVAVYQWVKPIAEAYYADRVAEKKYTVREYNGKKIYVHAHRSHVILQYDDRTTIHSGTERGLEAYLTSKRGVLPKWFPAKAWESFKDDHVVIAVDMAAIPIIRREMKHFVDRSPPIVQAVFTSVSPFWEDATSLAVGARLDDRLTVHTRVATKDADSSERLQRTAEALKTLVQSAVENTRKTVQSGGQPEDTIILAMLDVADGLLANLKFQQEGNEVQLDTSATLDEAQIRGLLSPIAAARKAASTSRRYTASAYLRVARYENPILSPTEAQGLDQDRFEIYKNTQREMLLSRFVFRAALQNPEMAKLPSVQQATAAGDAVKWLRSQLRVSFPGNKEIMEVSFSSTDPKEAATLVNIVVNTYLKKVVNAERQQKLSQLEKLKRTYADREEELKKMVEQSRTSDSEAPSTKSVPNIEKKLADIKKSDPILRQVAMEIEQFKADFRAAPRVMLFQKAEVPEMPSRR